MLKYLGEPTVTFSEFPDEIALCFNITNCPGNCSRCSEPELLADTGEELTEVSLISAIQRHPGVTLIGILGGDRAHDDVAKLVEVIHRMGLKAGMYSGQEYLDMDLLNCLDYYKIGAFRMFEGPEDTWKNQTAGPIVLPTSNQIMFKRIENKWINITDKFRTKKISNWKTTIL